MIPSGPHTSSAGIRLFAGACMPLAEPGSFRPGICLIFYLVAKAPPPTAMQFAPTLAPTSQKTFPFRGAGVVAKQLQ